MKMINLSKKLSKYLIFVHWNKINIFWCKMDKRYLSNFTDRNFWTNVIILNSSKKFQIEIELKSTFNKVYKVDLYDTRVTSFTKYLSHCQSELVNIKYL